MPRRPLARKGGKRLADWLLWPWGILPAEPAACVEAPDILISMIKSGDGKGSEPPSYERIVFKNASEFHYLKIHLEFQEDAISLNAVEFKQLIISALKRLHGEVGAALPVDVLTYEEKTLSAILRVPNIGLVKLWSALTLLSSYQNRSCAFRVIQTSPFLLALAGNSRELVLD
ncbi:ribonuclease P protein subunit p14 isoform X1 [Tiliqua scincoides]|uniref:ribonuclease P protein subunit p14 isoform X1 n=2 Tax=Tiliqua scincoides TaxID=71010 RepID=UPI0034637EE6